MATMPVPLAALDETVAAYHAALDAGWPAGGSGQGKTSALVIAARTLGFAGKSPGSAIAKRLSTAMALGREVRGWRIPDHFPAAAIRRRYALQAPTGPAARPRVRVKAGSAPLQAAAPPAEAEEADPIGQREEQSEAAYWRGRAKKAEMHIVEERRWRRRYATLTAVEPISWPAAPALRRPNTLTPVLFTSDFQCGERIFPEQIDGMNRYDGTVFAERYQAMIDKTITLAEQNTGASDFPGAIYLRGGDAISGEIHAELAETNDLSSIPALKLLRQHEREGIRRLRDRFGRVRVISIAGNHGRTTFKPHAKGYSERSFETLLAWWLADAFEYDPAVTFHAPESGDALFEVAGWSWLMSHGDRMGSRGGQGFIGPAATIARGHKKLYDNWTLSGRRVDLILTGHLHTSLKLERGYANGSLAGYSEYARDLRATPDAPKQWLLFAHEEHMVSHAFELQLGPRPHRGMLLEAA